jgi:branched-chain amino acid transport system permease protein
MGLVALATVGTTYVIANSKFGLRLLAIREDEIGAEVMGINTTFYKLAAFVLSAFFAGVVGGIYAWHMSYIEPESSFALLVTIEMIIMAMFGGRATVLGPVIGATSLYLASEMVWARFPEAHLAVYGLLIIVVVLYMPQGVMGMMRQRDWVPRGW